MLGRVQRVPPPITARQADALRELVDWLEENGWEGAGMDEAIEEYIDAAETGRKIEYRGAMDLLATIERDIWWGYEHVGDEEDLPVIKEAVAQVDRAREAFQRSNPSCGKPKKFVVKRQGTGIKGLPAIAPITGPADVAAAIAKLIGDNAYEVFIVLYLNVSNCVEGYQELTAESMTHVDVSVSSVMRNAVLAGAVGIVTAHQHPSGNTYPSDADRALWRRFRAMANEFELVVLDNLVVVADGGYYSEAEDG